MTNPITDISQHRAVKVAGFMFLFSFIVPTLNWALVLSKLIVADSAMASTTNILANELLFRFGNTIELVMSVGLVVLAVALYSMLKTVNRHLALLALVLKVIEASLVAILVLLSLAALLMANGSVSLPVLTPEQSQLAVGFLLNTHTVLYAIPMVFLGVDMSIFCYLFLKSNYIPRPLAGFGILSFVLILIHALGYLIVPNIAGLQIAQMICYTPSGILELVLGTWLLVKGINTQLRM
jgi:hypothetical protein